jgi:transposase
MKRMSGATVAFCWTCDSGWAATPDASHGMSQSLAGRTTPTERGTRGGRRSGNCPSRFVFDREELPVAGTPLTSRSRGRRAGSGRASAADHGSYRRQLGKRGIKPDIARRKTGHGSGLGRWQWVVEPAFTWLHQFKRLLVRSERVQTATSRSSASPALLSAGAGLARSGGRQEPGAVSCSLGDGRRRCAGLRPHPQPARQPQHLDAGRARARAARTTGSCPVASRRCYGAATSVAVLRRCRPGCNEHAGKPNRPCRP